MPKVPLGWFYDLLYGFMGTLLPGLFKAKPHGTCPVGRAAHVETNSEFWIGDASVLNSPEMGAQNPIRPPLNGNPKRLFKQYV